MVDKKKGKKPIQKRRTGSGRGSNGAAVSMAGESPGKTRIAIQGYEGSFHQMVAQLFFGKNVEVITCPSFRDVIRIASSKKESDGGVMAIENSIAGSILPNYNLLQNSSLKITGEIFKKKFDIPQPPKYQDVFGYTIIELAEKNDKIFGITPAMPSGSSLKYMMEQMPNRAFDVGITEQHAVTLSAGMATQGLKVFCNIYSSFMQRAYDQVVHDVAIQKLPVIFCLDRAGLVGEDGPTHHGAYDIAYMRCVPGMVISAPMNESELRNLMYTAQLDKTVDPFVIRYPRGEGVMPKWRTEMKEIKIGTGRKLKDGKDIAILSIGHPGNFAAAAIRDLKDEGLNPAHYDMRFAKPLDEEILHEVFGKYDKIITVEDGTITGGFGTAVAEFMIAHKYAATIKMLGIPDHYIEHGSLKELHRECGYDANGIADAVREMMREKISVTEKV